MAGISREEMRCDFTWAKTTFALSNLETLLTCSLCQHLVQDPCTLEACDHHFCRNCVEKLVGVDSKCPECGAFAWFKDLKVNRRLAEIVSLCTSIRNTVGKNADGTVTPVNTLVKEETYSIEEPMNAVVEQLVDVEEEILSINNSEVSDKIEQSADDIDNNVYKEIECKLESCNSQEFENEDMGSSIELFSINDSFCSENDIKSGTQENYLINASAKDSSIATCTCTEDIPATSLEKSIIHNTEALKVFDIRTIPSNYSNIQGNNLLAVKAKKRKMSESELDAFETGNSILETTINVQEQLLMLMKNTPENEKCQSYQKKANIHDSNVDNGSSSTKKRSRLSSHQENRKTSPTAKINISTPQSKIRKQLVHSPASIVSVMELSPAQLTKRNKRGEGLLHIAAIKGNVVDAVYLLEKGADPNARDNAGWSPLHEACNHGHVGIAELLLDNGAIIDLPGGPEHETPLHDAVANGRLEVTMLLIKRGASLSARSNQGLTPIDYAFTDSMKELLKQTFSSTVQYQASTANKENIFQINYPQGNVTAKVLLYTGLNIEQKEKLELCASILGGRVVNQFSADVTHIITTTTNSGFCRRTMKYLCGILCGKWIVSFGWITKCLSASTWIEESPYEVKGTSNAKPGIPSYARFNHLQQLPGLFDGCQFFFSGTFDPKTPGKDELIKLVKYGGGKILTREPKQEIDYSLFIPSKDQMRTTPPLSTIPTVAYHAQPDTTQYRCTIYSVYDPLSQNKQPARNVGGPSIAPVGWLLDCISNFEIMDIETFLLT